MLIYSIYIIYVYSVYRERRGWWYCKKIFTKLLYYLLKLVSTCGPGSIVYLLLANSIYNTFPSDIYIYIWMWAYRPSAGRCPPGDWTHLLRRDRQAEAGSDIGRTPSTPHVCRRVRLSEDVRFLPRLPNGPQDWSLQLWPWRFGGRYVLQRLVQTEQQSARFCRLLWKNRIRWAVWQQRTNVPLRLPEGWIA